MWDLDYKESWAPKIWCFLTVLLKAFESPFDCKEIQPVHPKGVLDVHWKDWCWSWNFSTLANWCKDLTRWKRPWCWERLRARGEGDNRGWDAWMASPSRWTWVCPSGKLQELVPNRETRFAAVCVVAKRETRISDWTELYWGDLKREVYLWRVPAPSAGGGAFRQLLKWVLILLLGWRSWRQGLQPAFCDSGYATLVLFPRDNAYGHNQKERGVKGRNWKKKLKMHVINVSINVWQSNRFKKIE